MSIQNEFSSFKLLLKQIYSAHTMKVKELENEVKALKEKLLEKERLAVSTLIDCKRCVELEEAFKSCKKALHEQSKWFENFGQKFSIFNSPELGSQDLKSASKFSNCVPETVKTSRSLKSSVNKCDKSESSVLSLGESTITESKINGIDKIPMVCNNQNLLTKVMHDDGNTGSFDACTVTFPENVRHENVNAKSDSLILAPDSLDTSLDTSKDNASKHKSNKILNSNVNENLRVIERNYSETKASGKRLSSESLNDDRVKRCNTGNQAESSIKVPKTKDIKTADSLIPKIVVSNETSDVSKPVEVRTKTALKDSNVQNVHASKKKSTVAEVPSKENKIETTKGSVNNLANDLKNKVTPNQVSPSLLPTNANVLPQLIDLESVSNDNDDFQEPAPISKSAQIEDSWESCDKKKLIRKNKNIKSIRTTSKYKMTLDAPPLNYKKPNYKQTKLSKSIFKPKEVNFNKKSPEMSPFSQHDDDFVMVVDDNPTGFPPEHFETSTQCHVTKSPCTVDIDETFIPENFKLESPHCVTSSVKKNAVEKSHLKNGGLFSNISFPEELRFSTKDGDFCKNRNEIEDHSSFEDVELKENMNSFDRLPVPEEPNYKYKNDVVRKKSERRQLNGFDCKECEEYYADLGLTEKEKKERMKKCSRHRAKFTPPSTPDHFWELDFPDTEECKARGYMNATQKVKLNNICNI